MNVAVLSDIHSNYVAFKACVEFCLQRNIKTFIFLGDYTGELAYPQKTMELVYEMKEKYDCYFIKGNKEDYWLEHRKNEEIGWKKYDSTTGSLYYTYHNLSEKDFEFYSSLKITEKVSFEGMPSITICHGSPYRTNQKLLPNNERTYEIMDSNDTSIILCGHTHIQGKIEHDGKLVLNAGSVGVSLFSEGAAQFLILHGENGRWEEEFISLNYDVERVIDELDKVGLDQFAPSWTTITKHLLRTGEVAHARVLVRAMELCEEEIGECVWPNIPEEYWNQAIKESIK